MKWLDRLLGIPIYYVSPNKPTRTPMPLPPVKQPIAPMPSVKPLKSMRLAPGMIYKDEIGPLKLGPGMSREELTEFLNKKSSMSQRRLNDEAAEERYQRIVREAADREAANNKRLGR